MTYNIPFIDDNIFLDPISKEEELTKIRKYQSLEQGPEKEALGSEIICHNLKYLARESIKKHKKTSIPAQELFSQGKLGMWECLNNFDASKGLRFLTYAKWFIKKSHAEVYVASSLIMHKQTKASIEKKRLKGGVKEEENPLLFTYDSMDRPLGEEGSTTVGEAMTDVDDSLDGELDARYRSEAVARALGSMDSRRRRVLELSYGFNCSSRLTHKDIGVLMGISKERVRQLKESALSDFDKALKDLGLDVGNLF